MRAAQAQVAQAAQASPAMMQPTVQQPLPQEGMISSTTVNPAMMDMNPNMLHHGTDFRTPDASSPRISMSLDDKIKMSNSPQPMSGVMGDMLPVSNHLDEYMMGTGDIFGNEALAAEFSQWLDFPANPAMDMYSGTVQQMGQPEMAVPSFTGPVFGVDSMYQERGDLSSSNPSPLASISHESAHSPTTNMTSGIPTPKDEISEYDVVIAAEAAWPLARCNPPIFSSTCPRTARVHLESLENKSHCEGTSLSPWGNLEMYLSQIHWDPADLASVVPMTPQTRDKMLAIAQTFLHKALDIHRGGIRNPGKTSFMAFLVLPPSSTLQFFLQSYVRSLTSFYSLVSTGCIDPNELLQNNNQASTLLVLLMIAQGASAVPTLDARTLSSGLIETCRISLFDIIEKNVEMSADPTALRSALLFTLLGAWSGDKWLMDIAMGQRGMYLSMLKHAGMLTAQPSMMQDCLTCSPNTIDQWRMWMARETRNRLVYNWVMVDQELSLFHDTAPILSINELCAPLPCPERLWTLRNADQWKSELNSMYNNMDGVSPQFPGYPLLTPSLYDLFQNFLHESDAQVALSAHQLRLLLHPLQNMLCSLKQVFTCLPPKPLHQRSASTSSLTQNSTMERIGEVKLLLSRWYDISMKYWQANPDCSTTKTNLVLYHLISLNAITNFPEIERLARKEDLYNAQWELPVRYKSCIYSRDESVLHSGQVLALIRSMPADKRPTWWAAAIYRAIMTLWVESLSRQDTTSAFDRTDPITIPANKAMQNSGNPWETRLDETVILKGPAEVISYALDRIDDGVICRLGDGIKRKLTTLNNNWSPHAVYLSPA